MILNVIMLLSLGLACNKETDLYFKLFSTPSILFNCVPNENIMKINLPDH